MQDIRCSIVEKPISLRETGESTVEYRYIVHTKAFETFTNLLRTQGINIPEKSARLSFKSRMLLDMRQMKEKGLLWSYSIIRVRSAEEVVEEG